MRSPLIYFGEMVRDVSSEEEHDRWSPQAIADLADLVIMALDEDQALDLLKGVKDWNLESERANAITERLRHDPSVAREKKMAHLTKGDELGVKFGNALVQQEIETILEKMKELNDYTRHILRTFDASDPDNEKFYPDWLISLDLGIAELTEYYRKNYIDGDKGKGFPFQSR